MIFNAVLIKGVDRSKLTTTTEMPKVLRKSMGELYLIDIGREKHLNKRLPFSCRHQTYSRID